MRRIASTGGYHRRGAFQKSALAQMVVKKLGGEAYMRRSQSNPQRGTSHEL
jgi:hypothetical protein